MSKLREVEVLTEMLQRYQQLSCLWDMSDPHYMNRDLKQDAYQRLLDIYVKIKPDATIDCVKHKIDMMRGCYRREKIRVERKNQEAAGNEIFISKLWYYGLLSFLDVNPGKSRLYIPAQEPANGVAISDKSNKPHPPSFSQPARPPAKRREMEPAKESDRVLIVSAPHLSTEDDDDDDWDLMGRSLAVQLKKLPTSQRIIANKLISDVIYYGNLGKLSENSMVNVSSPPCHSQVIPSPNVPIALPAQVDLQKLLRNRSVLSFETPRNGQTDEELELIMENGTENFPTLRIENGMVHLIKQENNDGNPSIRLGL
ncbi:Alcohol dehydrogenase transcription factor Myb/SANT-like [Nesidiocoris tenuis]|uniref:Alcohol dehydrogenase transcription factor Myb/SANT-like n=1 Tax=Nesidiocoris tenuis TaxID=355587 RepID=A0ABN7BCG6_9HEMI|nr:Alcohol dehydrogenase transcription factor Myb/SANT-like [Nesidiocoris tenuis]